MQATNAAHLPASEAATSQVHPVSKNNELTGVTGLPAAAANDKTKKKADLINMKNTGTGGGGGAILNTLGNSSNIHAMDLLKLP